jgi:N-acetyl-anhydromuramyl-L-alanine amidase AmpD
MSLKITKNMLPTSKYPIKSPYSMTPIGVCVHNTANDAPATNEIAYMIRNDFQISFHYAVDDVQAVQGIPENRNGWHAGDGNGAGNRKHIGIEICYSKSGGDRFVKAEQNAVLLIVDILKRYGWGIDRVKKHQDFSGKYCPHRTLDMGWDRFLNMVKTELEGGDWKKEAQLLPEDQRKYVANKDTALYAMANGKVIKEFKKGQDIGVMYQVGDWYVTGYSFDRDIRNGFKVADFDIYAPPEEDKPPLEVPDTPEDTPTTPNEIERLTEENRALRETNDELLEKITELENTLEEKDETIKGEKELRKDVEQDIVRLEKDLKKYKLEYQEKVTELNELKKKQGVIGRFIEFLKGLFEKQTK